ncbi:hypothetical protein Ahy_B07g086921 [Arachis hypogaea]|uniref:Protein FAR1-RELATED SEQUENCE n=1 Tax=Arachis hypogaea TaxID=3818 RepID=A0A444YB77_ARAHY|nr:hypothetical protein Ahy_B07g086921 [Arachis hypogaea]
MNDSTLNQLNESDLDYSSESYQAEETRCVVDEQFVPKIGMTLKTLEEAGKFYKNYSKLAGFSTKIRNMTQKEDEIKNQLIVCSREGRWKSKISPTLKTNPLAGINCPARIYVYILKDTHSTETGTISSQSTASEATSGSQVTEVLIRIIFMLLLFRLKHAQILVYVSSCFWFILQSYTKIAIYGFQFTWITTSGTDEKHTKEREHAHIFQQCLLFKSRGILCRHSLCVLNFEQVDNVAPKYILECWSKNIKRRHTHIKSSQDEPLLESRIAQYLRICVRVRGTYQILHRALDNVMDEMQEYQTRSKEKSSLTHEEATLNDMNDLQSPPHLNLLDSRSMIQSRLERETDGLGSLMASDFRITCSLILFILSKRMFGPYSRLKASISSYNSIERNLLHKK